MNAAALADLQRFADVMLCPPAEGERLRRAMAGAQAIIIRSFLPDDIFDEAPTLIAAVRHGTGPDMLPLDRATALGIAVATVPGVNANAVAEFAVAQMLQLARGIGGQERTLRERGWAASRALPIEGTELAGKTLGIVGFGSIGVRLAEMCHFGFRMPILSVRRSSAATPDHVRACSLPELVRESDFIVVACPLTPQTTGLLSRELLALAKPGAFVVNVARGPVVDEGALLDALHSGTIAGAALDVFDREPLPDDSPVLRAPNLLATPHAAGATREASAKVAAGAVDETRRILSGQKPASFINPLCWDRTLARRARWIAGAAGA